MSAKDVENFFKLIFSSFKLMILLISFLVLPFVIAERRAVRERQKRLMATKARELGFRLSDVLPERQRDVVRHLDELEVGGKRFAFNFVEVEFGGYPIVLFDYHYATSGGTWWWSPSWRIPNYMCVVLVDLEKNFPELVIGPEGGGLFKRIAEAFGGGDIDFESYEFSEAFDVRSQDKKFAYDFCNAQMIEYLLENKTLSLEVDQSALAMAFRNMHNMNEIRPRLEKLVEIRGLMPNYLFEGAHG